VIKLQQAAGILSEQTLNRLNALLKDAPPSDAPGAAAPGAATPSPEAATP